MYTHLKHIYVQTTCKVNLAFDDPFNDQASLIYDDGATMSVKWWSDIWKSDLTMWTFAYSPSPPSAPAVLFCNKKSKKRKIIIKMSRVTRVTLVL